MKRSIVPFGFVAIAACATMAACTGGPEDPIVSSATSAVWSGDVGIGGAPGSDLALASWGPGRYDLFYTTGGHLKHRWNQGAWSPEEDLGGDLASAPAAVSWAVNRIDIFAMGRQNQLMHLWFDGSWHPWESLGGLLASAPAVASWAPGRLDIFYAAFPTGLGHIWLDQGWHPQEVLDSSAVYGAPAAVSWAPGRIDVFARMAPTGGPLWHKWYQQGWAGWEALGGNIASAPAATSWGTNRLDAFYLGPDGALRTQYWDGSWHAEASLSGSYSGAPGAVATPSTKRIDVVLPQPTLGTALRSWISPSISVSISAMLSRLPDSGGARVYAAWPGESAGISWSITATGCDSIYWVPTGDNDVPSSPARPIATTSAPFSIAGTVSYVVDGSKFNLIAVQASCMVNGLVQASGVQSFFIQPSLSPPPPNVCFPLVPGANTARVQNSQNNDSFAVWMRDYDAGVSTLEAELGPFAATAFTVPTCHRVDIVAVRESCASDHGVDPTGDPASIPIECLNLTSVLVGRADGSLVQITE